MRRCAACVVISHEETRPNTILAAYRAGFMKMGNLWHLPGGKLENGESFEAALIREMKEELGIEVMVEDEIANSHAKFTFGEFDVHFFRTKIVKGVPRCMTAENEKLWWMALEDVRSTRWIVTDQAVAELALLEGRILDRDESVAGVTG